MTLLTQGEAVSGNRVSEPAPSLVPMPLSLIGSSVECMHDMHKSHARGHQPPSSFDLMLEAFFRADQVIQWGFSLSSDTASLASHDFPNTLVMGRSNRWWWCSRPYGKYSLAARGTCHIGREKLTAALFPRVYPGEDQGRTSSDSRGNLMVMAPSHQ